MSFETLKENVYPGRGIIIGKSKCARYAFIAYFIMGRSLNSRNRIFVEDGDGIRTEAFDKGKLVDPSLIIYSPVKVYKNMSIVTNGDQTDTIYEALKEGSTFEQALSSREYEPDEPNFTPRISGLLCLENDSFSYKLSILKSENQKKSDGCQRFFYEYEKPIAGKGHMIHTYEGDGEPIPSFSGEPVEVNIEGGIDEFTKQLWKSLNESNKVSLFVRRINLKTKEYESRIINKEQ